MAYTPTNWECGDTVTAEKLNNIERGVAEMNSEYTPTTWECGDLITAEKMNKIEQGIANAGGGGGGSSDFSTAEVTITNNGSNVARFVSPVILGNDTISPDAPLLRGNATLKVIFYKDACYNDIVIIDTTNDDLVEPSSLSGNVTYDDEGMTYTITGDCTITIS